MKNGMITAAQTIVPALSNEPFVKEQIINGITEFSAIRQTSTAELSVGPKESERIDWRNFGALDIDIAVEQCESILSLAGILLRLDDPQKSDHASRVVDASTGCELQLGHEFGVPSKVFSEVHQTIETKTHAQRLAKIKHQLQPFYIIDIYARFHLQIGTAEWLAASALTARWIDRNDFSFGCLVTELRNKLDHERDTLRGRKVIEAASFGGRSRAQASGYSRERLYLEIVGRLQDGQRISNICADIVARDELRIIPASLETGYRRWKINQTCPPLSEK